MTALLKDQTKDLTTCSICLETFNQGTLKPKLLPCSYTYCLKCIKVIIPIIDINKSDLYLHEYTDLILYFRTWRTFHHQIKSTVSFVENGSMWLKRLPTAFQTTCLLSIFFILTLKETNASLTWRIITMTWSVPTQPSQSIGRLMINCDPPSRCCC